MARKATDQVQLKLRFDERLRRKLEAAATKNNRSMNAEIIGRLEQSFQNEDIKDVVYASAARTTEDVMKGFKQFIEQERQKAERKP